MHQNTTTKHMIPSPQHHINIVIFSLFIFLLNSHPTNQYQYIPLTSNISHSSSSPQGFLHNPSETDHQTMTLPRNKKQLRRLPHVFSKVLELPFNSSADVFIEDLPDRLRFVAKDEGCLVVDHGNYVRTHVVEVHPGVTKLVVRRRESGVHQLPLIDDLKLDVWRFRLPASARPELATVGCVGGEMVVTVPKSGGGMCEKEDDCKSGFRGDVGRLILVQ